MLFTGGDIAVAAAEDRAQGFTERLLSLSVPRLSLVLGRIVVGLFSRRTRKRRRACR